MWSNLKWMYISKKKIGWTAKNIRLKGTCKTLKHTSQWVAAESKWRMAVPGLKPLRLLRTPKRQSCQSFFSLATPSPHKHLIAISILAIKCLSWACRWASPRCTLKIVWPYTCTQITTYTQITPLTPTKNPTPISLDKSTWWPRLYTLSGSHLKCCSLLQHLTKKCSSVGRAQAPHRLACCGSHPYVHFSNSLICVFSLYAWRDTCDLWKSDTSTQTGLCTPLWYATIPVLPCVHWHAVSVLTKFITMMFHRWRSLSPTYWLF